LTCPPRCARRPHGWPSLRAADRAGLGPDLLATGTLARLLRLRAARVAGAQPRIVRAGAHRRRRGPAVRGRRPGRARIHWFLVRAPAGPRPGSRRSSALPAAVFFSLAHGGMSRRPGGSRQFFACFCAARGAGGEHGGKEGRRKAREGPVAAGRAPVRFGARQVRAGRGEVQGWRRTRVRRSRS
jgi:hypothetical protein